MSDLEGAVAHAARSRTLAVYDAVSALMLLGIGVLVLYSIRLGSLTPPGAQQSFGYAIALMSLMGAALFHIADRTYRVWPLGRRYRPAAPGPVTTEAWVRFLKVVVVVAMAAAVAYLVGGLLV